MSLTVLTTTCHQVQRKHCCSGEDAPHTLQGFKTTINSKLFLFYSPHSFSLLPTVPTFDIYCPFSADLP